MTDPADGGFHLDTGGVRDDALDDTARRNRQSLLDAYRDIEKGDQTAFLALLADDIHFHQAPSLPYPLSTSNREDTLAGFGQVIAAWSKMNVRVEELVAAGDLVIAYMTVSATAAPTGKPYGGPCAELFRFRDGKVVEWRPLYWDTHAVRIAFDLA